MKHKLTPEQRDEVSALIEESQDDLECVLFRLVGQRDEARHALLSLRAALKQIADRKGGQFGLLLSHEMESIASKALSN